MNSRHSWSAQSWHWERVAFECSSHSCRSSVRLCWRGSGSISIGFTGRRSGSGGGIIGIGWSISTLLTGSLPEANLLSLSLSCFPQPFSKATTTMMTTTSDSNSAASSVVGTVWGVTVGRTRRDRRTSRKRKMRRRRRGWNGAGGAWRSVGLGYNSSSWWRRERESWESKRRKEEEGESESATQSHEWDESVSRPGFDCRPHGVAPHAAPPRSPPSASPLSLFS